MANSLLFSIIIPTYNRPEKLLCCLEALMRLDYSDEQFEVIIIDDGSNNKLEPLTVPFSKHLTITLIRQENAGPAAARNAGASKARGTYLAFTDDDCQPAPDWLTKLEACFHRLPKSAVTGKTTNTLLDNQFASASQLLIDYLYSYFNTDKERARFFTSNNLAISANLFHLLKGFNKTFPNAAGEDRELCHRCLHHGFQVIYEPDLIVYHQHRLTLRSFWQQHFNYGRATSRFHQIVALRDRKNIRIEPFSFYFKLLIYPLVNTRKGQTAAGVALLLLSQIATAAGFYSGKINL